MGVDVDLMDEAISICDLAEHGIEVVNVSGSFKIEGEFDRTALAEDLPNSEYEPEDHRNLIYHGDEAMILLPPGGRVSIVRATTPEKIRRGVEEFNSELRAIGLDRAYSDIQVENVVATADLECQLNLNEVVITLGFEETEYEPEQFPGVIYRPSGGTVILIFSSGKIVITAAVTYEDVMEAYKKISEELNFLDD